MSDTEAIRERLNTYAPGPAPAGFGPAWNDLRTLLSELDAAHQHLAEGATMMEALLADRDQLAGVVESIASRRCLCDGHLPHKPHGGPCCGVAGGRCVTCEARAGLEQT